MKNTILILATIFLFTSCKKDEVTQSIENQYSAKSTYNTNLDGDDHDENESECCSFKYGQWSTCAQGYQVRSWTSRSTSCIPPLDSIQRTCESAIIQYFYYNAGYTSLRVVSNIGGLIHIYNANNQITSILPYNAGGNWISIDFLPSGLYYAKTYTRTIRFTR